MYHGLCKVARERGYALAIHGTVTADLDLIAIPWTPEAVPAEELRDALAKHIGACGYEDLIKRTVKSKKLVKEILAKGPVPGDPTVKPHGRLAWNLHLDFGAKVDLSVMPLLPPP